MLLTVVMLVLAAGIFFNNYLTMLAGMGWGLSVYLIMHRILHQKWSMKVFKRLSRYHIFHHCKFPNTCFGISVPWWDDFFRTIPPKQVKISPRIIAFYFADHAHHE
jgi:sterol desaturase/sphingolipid hydroxylase (fatty acid hydroxylase superfamily)